MFRAGLAVGDRGGRLQPSRRTPSRTLVDRLSEQTLPNASETLATAAEETGVVAPEKVAGWGERVELWQRIVADGETFDAGIYTEDLDHLMLLLSLSRWAR